MIKRSLSIAACGVLVASSVPVQASAANVNGLTAHTDREFALTAGATVLTLEGGLVGLQHLLHFTPLQLRGDLCDSPNRCKPVDYFAMPLGQPFNDMGAVKLNDAIDALPADGTPVVLYGHSQGGQVIYSALRGWAADPASAPDPALVSWVSIGNPENTFGGRDPDPIPADSPYQGTEVIRQYDGWADWPTDDRNLLAVLNAVIGMSRVHTRYFNVDINAPDNIRYVEGNVTYVFVPNPVLPLVQAAAGPLAPLLNPILDPILRPMVEAGYQRPVGVNPGAAAPVAPRAVAGQAEAPAPVSLTVSPGAESEADVSPDVAPSPRGSGSRRLAVTGPAGSDPSSTPRADRKAATAGNRESRNRSPRGE